MWKKFHGEKCFCEKFQSCVCLCRVNFYFLRVAYYYNLTVKGGLDYTSARSKNIRLKFFTGEIFFTKIRKKFHFIWSVYQISSSVYQISPAKKKIVWNFFFTLDFTGENIVKKVFTGEKCVHRVKKISLTKCQGKIFHAQMCHNFWKKFFNKSNEIN